MSFILGSLPVVKYTSYKIKPGQILVIDNLSEIWTVKVILWGRGSQTISIGEPHFSIPNVPIIIILISFFVSFKKKINIRPIADRHVVWSPQNSNDTGSFQRPRTTRIQHYWNILIFFLSKTVWIFAKTFQCWCPQRYMEE